LQFVTASLTLKEENRLMFENRMLRRIFGANSEEVARS
jgi:hypothetical protein